MCKVCQGKRESKSYLHVSCNALQPDGQPLSAPFIRPFCCLLNLVFFGCNIVYTFCKSIIFSQLNTILPLNGAAKILQIPVTPNFFGIFLKNLQTFSTVKFQCQKCHVQQLIKIRKIPGTAFSTGARTESPVVWRQHKPDKFICIALEISLYL